MTFKRLMDFISAEDGRLRKRYNITPQGNEWRLTHVIKLMEEIGELSEQIVATQAAQRPEKRHLYSPGAMGEEVADVLIATLLVARDFEVDVSKALATKMKKIESRYQEPPLDKHERLV